ncbi:MAG: hypothetical protein AVDCRST_MAG64-3393 [uncultured Phycisphaerae bacterium]|uniref:Uncharacterized protein n=1 Tax=uncultured Phycisphaerae bacterium TaxID=904963 RepID=A0A6J4Q0Y2_9BACT|nr:MAG: hypothetical protein AVDCRST_MAG64-3393 [uncultured Phycisphaerae bacterium]
MTPIQTYEKRMWHGRRKETAACLSVGRPIYGIDVEVGLGLA